ncbi:hypothetical protein TNCV_1342201 [Trichonephila clavipes]|uniref:Uncharacterized protein n=1 Tax=Trichonephila clavipes TaxID=2585209 RepID=A0A8X6RQY3_TRICX|nr:hypothetical protein TNCV_1342201 [Trichonephila clavipes]
MYIYRCPCIFNTMSHLINRSDCRMVTNQSLGKFVVNHTIQDAPVCDAVIKIAAAIVSELRVRAAANVIVLFMFPHLLLCKRTQFLTQVSGSIKAMQVTCLSFRLLVIGRRSDPAWPSLLFF